MITCELLDALIHSFLTGDYENRTWLVDKLVQRFEVTKSIRSRYNSSLSKHTSEETSSALDEKFGLCLSLAYAHTAKLTYLNALLKLNDFFNFLRKSSQYQDQLPHLLDDPVRDEDGMVA